MRIAVLAMTLLTSLNLTAAELVPFSADQRTALGIETAPVATVETGLSARLPAQVAVPDAQLQMVAAPLDGLIDRLMVREGDAVEAGAVLARMQSPRLLELQSEYLETYTRFDLARSAYRRDEQLFKEGIIAERRLLESRAGYRELATSLARVRRLLELAGMDEQALSVLRAEGGLSGSLDIKAPLSGVVLQQRVTIGQRVTAADPLYQLGQLKPLLLEIHVPLGQAAALAIGQGVQVPEFQLDGRIIAIGQQVHGTDQGVLIRAEVREGAERLRPGQFVQVQLVSAVRAGLRVPKDAVFHAGGKSYVFAEQPAGFAPIEVQIASEEPGHLVIQADLGEASRVAVAGVAALKATWLGGGE